MKDKKYNGILKYSGSKMDFLTPINELINSSSSKYYVEPFLGSGAVFINLEKEFDHYYINDIEPSIIKIFEGIKKYEYNYFISFNEQVLSKFGNIKTDKRHIITLEIHSMKK